MTSAECLTEITLLTIPQVQNVQEYGHLLERTSGASCLRDNETHICSFGRLWFAGTRCTESHCQKFFAMTDTLHVDAIDNCF